MGGRWEDDGGTLGRRWEDVWKRAAWRGWVEDGCSHSVCELTWSAARLLLTTMRIAYAWMASALLLAGCSHRHAQNQPRSSGSAFTALGSTNSSALIVTPDTTLAGRVALVNHDGRFAVLNFPIGRLPPLGQQLNVYHLGLKVGEITVTGPQQEDNIVGNITTGDAAVGDAVRDR